MIIATFISLYKFTIALECWNLFIAPTLRIVDNRITLAQLETWISYCSNSILIEICHHGFNMSAINT